jgi:hypothetical protein
MRASQQYIYTINKAIAVIEEYRKEREAEQARKAERDRREALVSERRAAKKEAGT